ncbi:MAG: peptidase U32 family protein [Myxococcota bacterium]
MKPEVLAPAGDEASLRAAIRAGADAVYLGVQGFNARARASNFRVDELAGVMQELHRHGVKGYVTLNTLLFDHELDAFADTVTKCAAAGVDAVIVQDLGAVSLVRAIAPTLHIHASTQMTCTDASSVRLAAELGANRVVVGRELSLDDIAAIRATCDTELEVFVHGALCVSYSGQCLTSEAIGGRSANRGACAQACRLPYEFIVDGQVHDVGERAYLLSPQDLEASSLVPRLAELGVSSLKIEGRLKGPEYVGSAVRLYRAAVDGIHDDLERRREEALVTYSRGSGPGFLAGADHQRLVEGHTCEHRGLALGPVERVLREGERWWLRLRPEHTFARGAGLLIEGGHANQHEAGGRVWAIRDTGTANDVDEASRGHSVDLWLGPDVVLADVDAGRRVFLNDDPRVERSILSTLERQPHREALTLTVRGQEGTPLAIRAESRRGLCASAETEGNLERAKGRPLDENLLREKLGRLGNTPYELSVLENQLPVGLAISPSALNQVRRHLVEQLAEAAKKTHELRNVPVKDRLAAVRPDTPPPPPGLFVLCRSLEQADAAIDAGADGVWLDLLALTGTGRALESLQQRRAREGGAWQIGVAPPRIRKPGEEKIDRFLLAQGPDAVLVRSLGALREVSERVAAGDAPLFIGDFSLNISNQLSAEVVLQRGLGGFTPSFDLDAEQLEHLCASPLGPYSELVVHHPMPLFHTEHCVFAALLSDGSDYRTCGRPCERHTVSLRDRVGLDNPVEADVGCRNTVFHAQAQSAATLLPKAVQAGVRRFRIELVRENAVDVGRVVTSYRRLLAGSLTPKEVLRELKTDGGYGVVRGSLRVLP